MVSLNKVNRVHLYQFKNFDMDAFTELYLNIINPHQEIDESTVSAYHHASEYTTEKKRGVRNPEIIANKCMYLQDAIIRRGNSRFNKRTFSLNSEVLKAVIGDEYSTMLDVLIKMDYLEQGDGKGGSDKHWYYIPYTYSKTFTLHDKDVQQITITNARIQGYKDKTQAQVEKLVSKAATGFVDADFLSKYLTSLKYIRIADEQGLKNYINQEISCNPKSCLYYDFVYKSLEDKERRIYRIDSSHRFYHVLTNLNKNLKKYLTIDISLDCKNSHPVLFNHFIFEKYGISPSLSYKICVGCNELYREVTNNEYILDNNSSSFYNILFNNNTFLNLIHNVSENLRKVLKLNEIENGLFAKIQEDELKYIFLTCNGLLWDYIHFQHPDMGRDSIKEFMFGAVFYSKSSAPDREHQDDDDEHVKYRVFAKGFKKMFPSVFNQICDWKRDDKQEEVEQYMHKHSLPYNGKGSLPVAMMSFESDIFITILKKLYQKRWNAVHIHDNIVIPKDNNKNHPSREQVEQTMLDVYKDFGLSPTLG